MEMHSRVSILTALLLIGIVMWTAVASVPQTMNYQVMLTDDADQPLADQAVELVFGLWTSESGGTQEWTETHNMMTNSIGVVSVILGSVAPLDPDDFSAPLWLEVKVDGEIMAPRRELASAPYALRAGDADLLGGAAPGAYSLDGHGHDADYVNEGQGSSVTTGMVVPDIVSSVDGVSNDGGNIDLVEGAGVTITPNDGANTITIAATGGGDDGDWTIAGNDVYRTTGSVGIGTSSPDARLEVVTTSGEAGWFSTSDSGTYDAALVAENTLGTGATFAALDPPSTWPANPAAIAAFGGSGARAAYFYSEGNDDGVRIDGLGTGSALDARAHGNGYAGRFEGGGGIYVEADGSRAADFRTDYPSGDWNTRVVHAEYTYSGSNHGVAVHGQSVPADGYGSGGVFLGGYSGVQGGVNPTGTSGGYYYGVLGSANHAATSESGINHGVYGLARDNAANYGVAAEARNGLWAYGVDTEASGGNWNFGVHASATGGTWAYGIYARADSGDPYTSAGFFSGDVHVSGTLSKTAGSFKIDHPLDPEGKYLCHSFVESPDMMNVYNGNVVLDGLGEAWIEMPEWFEALNKDFRYQLTPIGGAAPDLHIAETMVGGRFMIAGGEPGMEVSWQVTGIRQDRYAEANRIQVEVDKLPLEAGKYIHPELYGRPREEAVDYVPPRRRDPGLSEALAP
jgi:hypothetical protein